MNDYVIINGVNSNTISGLKISKLPPITKPQMRTLIETIDGRDGDLITDLGYSAYDKQLEIGLWGTYDINEIISFFNQEGTITFSNEADKFYNFKIINQIDYVKLLKFKTAVVVMHCQPFKYPTTETPIEGTPTTITGEGESLTLNNTLEALLEIDLKGNTQQNGTPTPDTPIDIQVVSGDNTIEVCGKNILRFDNSINTNRSSFTYQVETQELIVCTKNASGGSFYATFETFIKEGEIYTLSCEDNTNRNLYCYKDRIWGEQVSGLTNKNINKTTPLTFTASYTGKMIIGFFSSTDITLTKPMLESGGTKTNYETYLSQTYPINLGTLELCKIGEYQDRIYKDSGKWYLHKEIGKVVLSDLSWTHTTSNSREIFYSEDLASTIKKPSSGTEIIPMYASNYIPTSQSASWKNGDICVRYNYGSTGEAGSIVLVNNNYNNTTDFINGSTSSLLYYPLATPTNTEITDTTLLSQLNAIENARSYDTQTNVSQTNNDYPFWLSASTTFNAPITINNIGNIYAKPILELEGSGNITINFNSQDILAISLGDTTTKIVLDIPNLEAYNPTDSTLMNRLVVGDYMKFLINSGNNTLKIDGNITSYRLTSYTRWL